MSYYYTPGGVVSSPLTEKPSGLYQAYPQQNGIPNGGSSPGAGMSPPNFTVSSANGLRGPSPNGISPYGTAGTFRSPNIPPTAGMYGTGIPMSPNVRSPGVGPSGMSLSNGPSMAPSQAHASSGLGPAATGLSAVAQAAQAYPHLAGAAGYPTSSPMSGYGQSLGGSPYSPYAMSAGYPGAMGSPSPYLNATQQQAYGGIRSPVSSYAGVPCSYPSSISSFGGGMPSGPSQANPMYGLQGLRGPVSGSSFASGSQLTGSTMPGYPGSVPGQVPSNTSMLPGAPVVPTPGYPSVSPYGRPL